MTRKQLINETVSKIEQLPDSMIEELNDFADFLLHKIEDKILQEGLNNLTASSKSFEFLEEEEDIYTVNDLKERYK
jgi:hypothetical protein